MIFYCYLILTGSLLILQLGAFNLEILLIGGSNNVT